MSLEAMAGKNPITHVGKLYSAAANNIAAALVAEVPGVVEAECRLLSQIGAPIDRPRMAHLCIRHREGRISSDIAGRIRLVAEREIARIPELWRAFLAQRVPIA